MDPGPRLARRSASLAPPRPGPATLSKKNRYYTVPPPPNAPAVSFDLYLVTADAPLVEFKETIPVGSLRLPSGATFHVAAHATQLGGNPEEVFRPELDDDARREALAGDLASLPAGPRPRIVLHMLDDDLQTLKLIEMALDLPCETGRG